LKDHYSFDGHHLVFHGKRPREVFVYRAKGDQMKSLHHHGNGKEKPEYFLGSLSEKFSFSLKP
jgi:hypothetical protein